MGLYLTFEVHACVHLLIRCHSFTLDLLATNPVSGVGLGAVVYIETIDDLLRQRLNLVKREEAHKQKTWVDLTY